MTITDHVVSLELAQRLKTLGVKQDSAFYWSGDERYGFVVKLNDDLFTYPEAIAISAFLSSELGAMLKVGLNFIDTFFDKKKDEVWATDPSSYEGGKDGDEATRKGIAKTEVDARAHLLIHLLESGVVSADKL